MKMKHAQANVVHASEIYGDFWLNSEPLTLHAMHGQVILLCFWDYTSDASLKMLQFVQEIHEKYSEMGLVPIGIHSPEFSFGRDPKLVDAVVQRLGVKFPIATDNTLMMRDAYRVQELPMLFLIDRDGNNYSANSGESGYERIERAVQALLREAGFHGELPLLMEWSAKITIDRASFLRPTPVVRTGYLHGSLGNVEGYSPELPAAYSDANVHVEGKFYADGTWLSRSDSFEYEGGSVQGHLAVNYIGNSAGAVIAAKNPGTVVRVLHDGHVPAAEERGEDLAIDASGHAVIVVREPKLYRLIQNAEFREHSLQIIPMEKETTVYSFVFTLNSSSRPADTKKKLFRNN